MVTPDKSNSPRQSLSEPERLANTIGDLLDENDALRARSAETRQKLELALGAQVNSREVLFSHAARPTDAEVVNHVDQAVEELSQQVADLNRVEDFKE